MSAYHLYVCALLCLCMCLCVRACVCVRECLCLCVWGGVCAYYISKAHVSNVYLALAAYLKC